MNSETKNKKDDDWELHPLFLSKIPTKQDIDKHAALSALISIINEEEEQESFSYEPRRKNLNKKITDSGEVIRKRDRRNMYEPYQSMANRNLGLKKSFGGRMLYNRAMTRTTTATSTANNYNSCNINNYNNNYNNNHHNNNNNNICNNTYTHCITKEEMGEIVNGGTSANNGNGNEIYGDNNNNDNNENDDTEAKAKRATDTSVGELVVCMSMLNLK